MWRANLSRSQRRGATPSRRGAAMPRTVMGGERVSTKELNPPCSVCGSASRASLPCQQSSCKLRLLLFGIVTGGLASGRGAAAHECQFACDDHKGRDQANSTSISEYEADNSAEKATKIEERFPFADPPTFFHRVGPDAGRRHGHASRLVSGATLRSETRSSRTRPFLTPDARAVGFGLVGGTRRRSSSSAF